MKLSLKKRIENYLRKAGGWINGGEIESLALSAKYKASNASRRCRELAEENILERKEEKGSVWYKYKPQEKTIIKPTFIEKDGSRVVQLTKEVRYV